MYKNTHYARVGGVTARELKFLEFDLLAYLDYDIVVDHEEHVLYLSHLMDFKTDSNNEIIQTTAASKLQKDNAMREQIVPINFVSPPAFLVQQHHNQIIKNGAMSVDQPEPPQRKESARMLINVSGESSPMSESPASVYPNAAPYTSRGTSEGRRKVSASSVPSRLRPQRKDHIRRASESAFRSVPSHRGDVTSRRQSRHDEDEDGGWVSSLVTKYAHLFMDNKTIVEWSNYFPYVFTCRSF